MPAEPRSTTETAFLADQLERSFYGGAWHGLALAEIVADLDAETALQQPGSGAHSLWQQVHHVRVWIDVAYCRIDGGAACDPAPDEDWPEIEDTSATSWQQAKVALEEAHRRLQTRVLGMDDGELGNPVSGSDPTVRGLLLGILQHNAYHGGQMSWLKRQLTLRRDGQ